MGQGGLGLIDPIVCRRHDVKSSKSSRVVREEVRRLASFKTAHVLIIDWVKLLVDYIRSLSSSSGGVGLQFAHYFQ